MIAEKVQDDETADKKAAGLVKSLLAEVNGALKREKDWRKSAHEAVKIYEAGKAEENSYNILYSNTDTLLPALYNSLPRPSVDRRFKDTDPMGLIASKITERTLEYLLDTDLGNQETFDDGMADSVLAALVPGRAQVWVKYDATLVDKPLSMPQEAIEEGEPGEALEHETKTYEAVEGETVCTEFVPWDRFLHGYGKRWADVPWVGRMHVMTKEEVEDNFGQEIAAKVEFTTSVVDEEDNGQGDDAKERATSEAKFATIYEIWHKRSKKVFFISSAFPDAPLKVVDDPLKLSGFFPCPKPLMFVKKVSTLTPSTLYSTYAAQAKELDRVSTRINKIVVALKVRGMYDATVEGLDKVLQADDNQLIPAENVAAMQQGQTIEKALWLVPIDKLINVLQQLYAQRQQVKQVIFEITGIADIMRGSSQASETLGAQQIKNQWGTLRLKRSQREVQRFARDILRLMAEVAVTKLSPETLKKMTGLPIPLAAEKEQAKQVMQQIQAQPQPPQMPGQPPAPPPQIPPEIQTAASLPSWEEILALLQDDIQRSYRIDIETNSTVDLDATEDKQDISELLNALAQFFNGVGPMVQSGSLPFDAAKAMLLGVVRRFRFGRDVEEVLSQMQAPPPPKPEGDGKSEAAVAAENAKAQTEQVKAQAAQSQAQNDMRLGQMEMQFKEREHAMRMEELARKEQLSITTHKMALEKAMLAPVGPKPSGSTRK